MALAALRDDQLADSVADYWSAIAAGLPTEVPGLYRLLAHNAAIVEPFHRFARTLFLDVGLDPVIRQLVIHRAVMLERCSHAWHQHLAVSASVGVEPLLIDSLGRWREASCYSPSQQTAIALTDQIVAGLKGAAVVCDADPDFVVAVEILAGFYVMIARFLNANDLGSASPVVWPDGTEEA